MGENRFDDSENRCKFTLPLQKEPQAVVYWNVVLDYFLMSAQVSNTEAFKSLFFHQLPPKGTQSQTELTRIVDHRFFSTQLQCKNKTKTQTNNKTTKLPKKFIKKSIREGVKRERENPEGNKSTTGITEKKGYNFLFCFFFYTNVCLSVRCGFLWGYKTPGEESACTLQYHSNSSGGSREAGPAGRLETAEFFRMALDVLGPSIWGSWKTDRRGRG